MTKLLALLLSLSLALGPSPFGGSSSTYAGGRRGAEKRDGAKAKNKAQKDADAPKSPTRDQREAVSSDEALTETGLARPESSSGPVYSKVPELTAQQAKR